MIIQEALNSANERIAELEKEKLLWLEHAAKSQRAARAMEKERDEARANRDLVAEQLSGEVDRHLETKKQRNDALTKLHAHQKNVPCSGCEGGHDTFWKTVTESSQWQAWSRHTREFDAMECEACGHISQKHFQAFFAWHISTAKADAMDEAVIIIANALSSGKSGWDAEVLIDGKSAQYRKEAGE